MNLLDLTKIKAIVKEALAEDIGLGDITTETMIDRSTSAKGIIIAKSAGVIAGLEVAKLIFAIQDKKIKFKAKVADGKYVEEKTELAEISGSAQGILIAERTALNFLQRLSGIATLTAQFVRKVRDCPVKIMDTRKTVPGLRMLDKYAVRTGGGYNHRLGLYDAILIKDNHLKVLGGNVGEAVAKAKQKGQKVEIEVRDIAQVKEALAAGADIILLDNMDLSTLAEAVKLAKGKALTEASGGITLKNVGEVAATGVDFISIGALTHSAPALDISLKVK